MSASCSLRILCYTAHQHLAEIAPVKKNLQKPFKVNPLTDVHFLIHRSKYILDSVILIFCSLTQLIFEHCPAKNHHSLMPDLCNEKMSFVHH